MSTEQSESAPAVTAPQVETQAAPADDITQQATTPNPTTQRVKNPNRVAAGKRVSERTRLAREQQKKDAEAYRALGENKAKAATEPPEPAPTTEVESPKSGGLSANQWIAIGGIGVSLLGIYYKREELKATTNAAFDKIKTPVPVLAPARVEPEPALATQQKGFKKCFKHLRVMHIMMSDRTIAHLLISSVAIGGIAVFWLQFTAKAAQKVAQLSNEMFADKAAEERKRQREIQEEVSRRIREIIIRREEAEEEEEAAGTAD